MPSYVFPDAPSLMPEFEGDGSYGREVSAANVNIEAAIIRITCLSDGKASN